MVPITMVAVVKKKAGTQTDSEEDNESILDCLQSSNSLERQLDRCKHEYSLSQSTYLDICGAGAKNIEEKFQVFPLGKPIPTYACRHPHGKTHVATLRVIK